MMQQSGGTLLLIGLLIAALGVAVSAYAGYQKDKLMAGADSELNFTKGLLLTLFVGVTGASQALGIEQGGEIAAAFAARFGKPLYEIGKIEAGAPDITWIGEKAAEIANCRGFSHF